MLVAGVRVPGSASMLATVINEEVIEIEASFWNYGWDIYCYNDLSFNSYSIWFG